MKVSLSRRLVETWLPLVGGGCHYESPLMDNAVLYVGHVPRTVERTSLG